MPIHGEVQTGVTYIIPVYNPDETLFHTLQSITRNNFLYEILVINDYSKSGKEILQKIKNCSNVRVVDNTKDKGISGSLNMGLSEVRSEYVARLDAGDFDRPDRIATQMIKLLAENADIVVSDMLVWTEGAYNYSLQRAHYAQVCGAIAPWSIVPHPTWVIRLTSITKSYRTENIRTEDYCFLSDNKFRIAISHEPAIVYDGRGNIRIWNEILATYFKVKTFILNSKCKKIAFVYGVTYAVARIIRIIIWHKKYIKR